jgi:diacylglycerol kinase family enzyme
LKIFLILNGGRKPVPAKLVQELKDLLRSDSSEHRVEVSTSLEHAHALVDEASAKGFDALWVGGGDGTIHNVLNHALSRGMILGVVPMGTVNALARSLGIPLKPLSAARHLLTCEARPMDVGIVNGTQRFLCFASIGFDAAVVHDVSGRFKRYGGRVAYFLAGCRALFRRKRVQPFEVSFPSAAKRMTDDGDETETETKAQTGYSLVVSNISNYAGFPMFHTVEPSSGSMELWLFRQPRIRQILFWAVRSIFRMRGRHKACGGTVGHYLITKFGSGGKNPLFLQLDGEAVSLGNDTEFRFECLPAAVRVLMSPKRH